MTKHRRTVVSIVCSGAVLLATTAVAWEGGPVAPIDFGLEDVPYVQKRGPTNRANEVLNVTTSVTYDSIQDAVTAATAGDTLRVTASLAEGQVLIDKNLTLEGATGAEVVSASVSTGSSGDNRGWFVVDTGVSLTVQDLVFDGAGYDIFQAFRQKGSGSFHRCTFRNIAYPGYAGTAIAAAGAGTFTIEGCSFGSIGRLGVLVFGPSVTVQSCVYAGKGAGDHLDYLAQVDFGGQCLVMETTVTNCQGVAADGSTSAGVFVTTFNGPGSDLTVTSSTFLNNTSGAVRGVDGTPDAAAMSAAFNRFFGNGTGIWDTVGTMTAENNWFGCNAGPTNSVSCDGVTGSLDADPWLVLELAADPDAVTAGETSTLTATVTRNSDGVETSGIGAIMDGTTIAFNGGTVGTVAPSSAGTMSGVATSVLSASVGGEGTVSTTLDNQTVRFGMSRVPGIPALDLTGVGLLVLGIVGASLLLLRRR